jgi:hypothetical protein
MFGTGAWNWRFILSSGHGRDLSGIVVFGFLPRTTMARQAICKANLPRGAFKAQILHHPCDSASGHIETCPPHLVPNLANAIDAEVLLKDTLDLGLQFFVTLGAIREARRVSALCQMTIERALSAELLRNSPAG